MDNITHSLTGVLAAKLIDQPSIPEQDRKKASRILFWLILASVNLPDIDVLFGLFRDPVFALKMHRGFTHSILFAPLLATLPAALFYRFGSVKNAVVLWAAAYIGILLHICFDLITPFGTQLFAPFFSERFSLDWMFIIDPSFTILLGILLIFARWFGRLGKLFVRVSAIFVMGYLCTEAISHTIAYRAVNESAARQGLVVVKTGALPQPLSVLRWTGIVQTDRGVALCSFSVLDRFAPQLAPDNNDDDRFTRDALATPDGAWYMGFARFPSVHSITQGSIHVVEIRDMQFTFDKKMAAKFGMENRPQPFTMRFRYDEHGALLGKEFR